MKTTLIALTAAAAFGVAGIAATPASATPIAPAHIAAHKAGHVQNVHLTRRPIRRHLRRHLWAPGPWAFGPAHYYNCFRLRHGFVCYY